MGQIRVECLHWPSCHVTGIRMVGTFFLAFFLKKIIKYLLDKYLYLFKIFNNNLIYEILENILKRDERIRYIMKYCFQFSKF